MCMVDCLWGFRAWFRFVSDVWEYSVCVCLRGVRSWFGCKRCLGVFYVCMFAGVSRLVLL